MNFSNKVVQYINLRVEIAKFTESAELSNVSSLEVEVVKFGMFARLTLSNPSSLQVEIVKSSIFSKLRLLNLTP